MGVFKIVSLLMLVGVISGADNKQLQISPFEKVVDGVKADWNSTDGANVEGSTEKFGAAMTWDATKETGTLWLVSRRYIPVGGGPARWVKPGGIVSTLQLPNKSWTHQPHTLDMNGIEIKVFSLGSHLLMLTYENENVIKYRKLYVWNETDWAEIPFDSSTVENPSGRLTRLSISGPDPFNNSIYLAASAYMYNLVEPESSATIAKLDIAFDSSSKKPISAKLTSIHRPNHPGDGPIACTPSRASPDRLYEFWDSSSTIKAGEWFSVDSNRTGGFPMNVPSEENNFYMDEDNCFQYQSDVIFFGQHPTPDGILVPHVWAYDLSHENLRAAIVRWSNASETITSPKVIADRFGAIYAVDVEKGVYVARISRANVPSMLGRRRIVRR